MTRSPARRPRRRLLSVVTCLGLLGIHVSPLGPAAPASAADGTITGTVFQDFNSNGVNDSAVVLGQAIDIGVAGIGVRAFDSTGAEVGTATTGATGTYSLAVTGAATNDVRIEFTIPTTDPVLSAYRPSFAVTSTGASGSASGSSVQFATIGNSGVNFAVNVPGEFCQSNPNLSVSRQCFTGTDAAPSIWVTRYNGGPYETRKGFSDLYPSWAATTAGTKVGTGAILGMTWDPRSRRVLSTAYVRRAAGMYESGGVPRPGAMFITTPAGTKASEGVGGSTSFLVDLETLLAGDQFSNPTAPASGVANAGFTGYIPTNAVRGVSLGIDSDVAAGADGVYEEVGKTGIGDIDTDGAGNVYVVSLYTRHLYKVVIPADGSAPTQMSSVGSIIQTVTCTNGTGRPFGVTYWRGNLYMGVVCDGSGDYSAAAPNSPTDDRNITYTVVRYAPGTGAWSNFAGPFPLYNATPGGAFKGSPIQPTSDVKINGDSSRWNPWTDTFTLAWAPDWGTMKPMPMPTDIQFDRDGSMIVSFRDRFGDMMGQYAAGAQYPDGSVMNSGMLSAGDIVRICRTGTGWTGADYTWEGGAGCARSFTNFDQGTPEFYRDDYGKLGSYHGDQSAGMLEQVPGFPEVLNSAMDAALAPVTQSDANWNAGGVSYYLNSTGNRQFAVNADGGVLFYWDASDGGFGKITGMGDIEALCDLAPVQIGDRLWTDVDGDGIQDPGEPPIVGATVRLYDASGNVVSTAITNSRGEYLFSSTVTEAANGGATPDSNGGNLQTGVPYTVRMDNPADYATGGPLSGYVLSGAGATTPGTTDSDVAIDSDASMVSGYPRIDVSALAPGGNTHTYDAGFTPLVAVSNFAWIDADADGVQDPGEAGLAGVTVRLLDENGNPALDANGNPVPEQTTDANGQYIFDNLLPGDYRASFSLPAGYAFAPANSSAAISTTDSDVAPGTGLTPVFTVAGRAGGATVPDSDPATLARFVNSSVDAGFVPIVSVGNLVWNDVDRDGVQDPGEPGISGVTLTITKADGSPVTDVFGNPVTSTTTDANGNYVFANLPPGQYTVTPATPSGFMSTIAGAGTSLTDSSTGSATSASLSTAGQSDTTLDFGFVAPAVSVGDLVWWDTDADGAQDAGEPGIPGVTLTITKADGSPVTDVFGNPVTSTTTDADGKYVFDNLPAGQYKVTVTAPTGAAPTAPGVGTAGGDSSTGSATSINLAASGARDDTLDFGFVPAVSVGNLVWNDVDRDGVQDPGEPGIPGVMLTITKADGSPVIDVFGHPVTSTTTDANGNYLFANLPPGRYTVSVAPPAGFKPTVPGAGTTANDSSTGSATSAVLTANGQTDATLDFGFVPSVVPTVSLGDKVWRDVNGDGLQGPIDRGVPGAVLRVFDSLGQPARDVNGKLVKPQRTGRDGKYLFTNLPLGTYTVRITYPKGLRPTIANQPNREKNSSTGSVRSLNLNRNGAVDRSLDFGVVAIDAGAPGKGIPGTR